MIVSNILENTSGHATHR